METVISIHAPAKGATCTLVSMVVAKSFQSTLPRRERPDCLRTTGWSKAISIHAPAKGATGHGTVVNGQTTISIHAPAKGATLHAGFHGRCQIISIHAPAKGATDTRSNCHTLRAFQSTLPRRERRQVYTFPLLYHNFNPRSREGSDQRQIWQREILLSISIHAPAKGATKATATSQASISISIHAPAKGATYK